MRERVRLTPEERLQLDLIEQHLRADDPALVRRLGRLPSRWLRPFLVLGRVGAVTRHAPALATIALLAGAVLVVAAMPVVAVAIAGYLVMVAGALGVATRGRDGLARAGRRTGGRLRAIGRRIVG